MLEDKCNAYLFLLFNFIQVSLVFYFAMIQSNELFFTLTYNQRYIFESSFKAKTKNKKQNHSLCYCIRINKTYTFGIRNIEVMGKMWMYCGTTS